VLELRRVETPFGPVWHGKHACPDNPATFRFLLEIAALDVTDPLARSVGLEVFRAHPKKTETKERAAAVMQWVRTNVRYIREPKETFQSPSYTIRSGAGDCDDHANLVHAIARNAGLPARVVPLWKDGQIRHAVSQVAIDDAWTWAETTVRAKLGEHPRAAVRRLKAARSDISGVPSCPRARSDRAPLESPEVGDLPTMVTPEDARRYIDETDAAWKRTDQDVERSGVDDSFRVSFATDLAGWMTFAAGARASVGWLNTKAVMDQTDRWVEKLDGWRRSLRGVGGATTGPDLSPAGQGVLARMSSGEKWFVGVSLGVAAIAAAGYAARSFRPWH
jgi:hypothetical protein